MEVYGGSGDSWVFVCSKKLLGLGRFLSNIKVFVFFFNFFVIYFEIINSEGVEFVIFKFNYLYVVIFRYFMCVVRL